MICADVITYLSKNLIELQYSVMGAQYNWNVLPFIMIGFGSNPDIAILAIKQDYIDFCQDTSFHKPWWNNQKLGDTI